jgi:hypothetical protein
VLTWRRAAGLRAKGAYRSGQEAGDVCAEERREGNGSHQNRSPVNIRFSGVYCNGTTKKEEDMEMEMDILNGRSAPSKSQPLLLRKKKYHILG